VSKYLELSDEVFKSRELLLGALADLGYTQVEEGERLPLYGYRGDRRPETAEIVVRRAHIGSASNDLGFRKTPAGYVPVISEYDRATLRGGNFMRELNNRYGDRFELALRQRLRGSLRRYREGSVIKTVIRG
jgi:hypothetical protein